MSSWTKSLIGLAVALAAGLLAHGPLGRGEAFVDALEDRARAAVAGSGVPGITVRMARDPLARTAILSGPADRFQREGLGSFPGLDDRVGNIAGMAGVEWTNPPPERGR